MKVAFLQLLFYKPSYPVPCHILGCSVPGSSRVVHHVHACALETVVCRREFMILTMLVAGGQLPIHIRFPHNMYGFWCKLLCMRLRNRSVPILLVLVLLMFIQTSSVLEHAVD